MIVLKTVLVAVDFSLCSEAALREGRRLSLAFNASLHLLHVVDEPLHETWTHFAPAAELVDMLKAYEARAQARLESLVAPDDIVSGRVVIATRWGNPSDEILRYAAEHRVDLIVCGVHGRVGLERAMLGSVSERVVRLAGTPVLTVPGQPMPVSA